MVGSFLSRKYSTIAWAKQKVLLSMLTKDLRVDWDICWRDYIDIDVEDVPESVAACCTLHNMCEIHIDAFDEEWLEGTDANSNKTFVILNFSGTL